MMLAAITRAGRGALARGGGTARVLRAMSASPTTSFLSGTNSVYIEEMHHAWQHDPASVHRSWDIYFRQIEAGVEPAAAMALPPDLAVGQPAVPRASAASAAPSSDSTRILHLVYAYQQEGHKVANLDPLAMGLDVGARTSRFRQVIQAEGLTGLDPMTYGFTEEDWERPLDLRGFGADHMEGVMKNADINNDGLTTLSELNNLLRDVYCGSVGYEYRHISDQARSDWVRARIEKKHDAMPKEEALKVLTRLARADKFERLLGTKFNTAKRFGIEGTDSMIPGLLAAVDKAAEDGVRDVVIGMPHRGRLNVLTNVVNKPMELIIKEFQGIFTDDQPRPPHIVAGHCHRLDKGRMF